MRRLALLTLAETAIRTGHAGARLGQWTGELYRRGRRLHDWKPLSIGPIELRTPPDWGDVEPAGPNGYVVHNQPAWARVDGDAVWYGNAIEIRFEPCDGRPDRRPPGNPAMTEETRSLQLNGETVVATMRIANGVGQRQRGIARRVFGSIRLSSRAHRANLPRQSTNEKGAEPVHAPSDGDSRVALDFMRHFTNSERLERSRTR